MLQNFENNKTSDYSSNFGETKAANLKIRNIWAIISGIVLLFCIIGTNFIRVIDYGDWTKTFSLSEFCTRLNGNVNKDYAFVGKIAGGLYYLTIASLIVIGISAFVDVKKYKIIVISITLLSLFATLILVFGKGTYIGDEYSLGTDCILLIVGVVLAIKSCFADKATQHSYITSQNTGLYEYEWRCSKCDTKNTSSICKVCGTPKNK